MLPLEVKLLVSSRELPTHVREVRGRLALLLLWGKEQRNCFPDGYCRGSSLVCKSGLFKIKKKLVLNVNATAAPLNSFLCERLGQNCSPKPILMVWKHLEEQSSQARPGAAEVNFNSSACVQLFLVFKRGPTASQSQHQ